MRELPFIEWIRQQNWADPATVPVGPGDDCAVIHVGDQPLLVTTDQVLDGVHVRLSECGLAAAGRKALARNLSDIAAMAGEPLAAFANVSLPAGTCEDNAKELYRGLDDLARAFACPLAGGDVAFWPNPLAVGVIVLGRPGPAGPVLRSGARPGQAICVTGRLGGAWRSGRDLTFTPRIAAARVLAGYGPSAMIDLSDGLGTDLRHLCEASGCGAELVAEAIPCAEDADLQAALTDGEDYELLFCLDEDAAEKLLADPAPGVPVSRIGRTVAGGRLEMVDSSGGRHPLEAGWEHHG